MSEERRYVKITTDRRGENKRFEFIACDATDSLTSPVVHGSKIKGAVPLKAGVVNVEVGKAQEKINLERFNGALLMMGDNQQSLGRKLNRRLEME